MLWTIVQSMPPFNLISFIYIQSATISRPAVAQQLQRSFRAFSVSALGILIQASVSLRGAIWPTHQGALGRLLKFRLAHPLCRLQGKTVEHHEQISCECGRILGRGEVSVLLRTLEPFGEQVSRFTSVLVPRAWNMGIIATRRCPGLDQQTP